MSQAGETFFTSVGCMDGRVQDPIAKFGRQKFGVLFADTITEAGLVGLLAKREIDPKLFGSLNYKIVTVSIKMHHSKGVIVHGHEECAGNPVNEEQHKKDIIASANVIKTLTNLPVIPVYVKRGEHGWEVEELSFTVLA